MKNKTCGDCRYYEHPAGQCSKVIEYNNCHITDKSCEYFEPKKTNGDVIRQMSGKMNLERLVPPLDLCKLIPAGEFVDSALMWFSNYHFGGFHVEKRGLAEALTDNGEIYPAPTLQEVMAELPACDCYRFTDKNEWTVLLVNGPADDGVKSDSPATAALKLWLKLKGIEYAE